MEKIIETLVAKGKAAQKQIEFWDQNKFYRKA